MINPDGVVLGNYRSNCVGNDMNRMFDSKTNMTTHPEIQAI